MVNSRIFDRLDGMLNGVAGGIYTATKYQMESLTVQRGSTWKVVSKTLRTLPMAFSGLCILTLSDTQPHSVNICNT